MVDLLISKFEELAKAGTSVFTSAVWPLLVRKQLVWGLTGLGSGLLLLIFGLVGLPVGIKRLAATGNEGWAGLIVSAAVAIFIGLIVFLTSIPPVVCPECEALQDLLRVAK